jgi:hypothetical protein
LEVSFQVCEPVGAVVQVVFDHLGGLLAEVAEGAVV